MLTRRLNPTGLRLAAGIGVLCAVGLEWGRVAGERWPGLYAPAALTGAAALMIPALAFTPSQLGFGPGRWPLRLIGGIAMAAVLLLPTALRWEQAPQLPLGLAPLAAAIAVGEEVAFRGWLFALLLRGFGPGPAVLVSSGAFALAHVLSHPPLFLLPVTAMSVLFGIWRVRMEDSAAPLIAHLLADLAI